MKRVSLMFLILSLTWSCGHDQTARTKGQSTIVGTIVGNGNHAPLRSRVDVFEPDSGGAPRRFQVERDGSFSVTASKIGAVRLTFAEALHNSYSVSLLLRKPSEVKMDVVLTPYTWEDKFREIRAIGDFNEFSRDSGYVFMVRQPDGTYAAELGNIRGDKMGYQLIGLVSGSSRAVPGTVYDELVTDPEGDFVSRLAVRNGTVRIVFDPASLPHSFAEAGVTFADSNSEVARIAAFDADIRTRQQEYSTAAAQFRALGNNIRDFHYDWSKTVAGLKRQLDSEKDPTLRQMLFISLLDLKRLQAQEIDAETAKQALAAIPPDSLLWELAARSLPYDSIKLAGGLRSYQGYFQAVVTAHPSREVRAQTLEQAYGEALSTRDLAHAKDYYNRLTTEFADLRPGQRVKSRPPEPESTPAK